MIVIAAVLLGLFQQPTSAQAALPQSRPTADCSEWRSCRELALAAAGRGEYETFHDLAWRAVQTGPRNDPALMFLLARAQALSNRPHDALVMLGRLADMGVVVDATGDDFQRTRQLPQWPEIEARIAAVAAGTPLPGTSVSVAGASSRSAAAAPASNSASAGTSVRPSTIGPPPVHFSTLPFTVSGLGYDSLSRRFVVGDRLGRKMFVVEERASTDDRPSQPIDLVHADSASFLDLSALEIDERRGDLWAVSVAPDGSGIVHRLQLVSGRPLRSYPVDAAWQPVQLVDLAIDRAGVVLVLDAAAPQLLMLRPGRTAVERGPRIDLPAPVSISAGKDDGIVFVAYRDGLARIDVRAQRTSRLALPAGLSLDGIQRIRWNGRALIVVQNTSSGGQQIVQLELNARGTAIAKASRLELALPSTAPLFVTISGDELVYLIANGAGTSSDRAEFVVQRVPLP